MFFFRADGSSKIGMGHVSRCLTIAIQFKKMGIKVLFLVSNDYAVDMIRTHTIDAEVIPCENTYCKEEIPYLKQYIEHKEPAVIIVDSYLAGDEYLTALEVMMPTIYIDGLYRCKANISGVINYNAAAEKQEYQERFAGKKTKLLIGREYAPIREVFLSARRKRTDCCHPGKELNVMITTGATDQQGVIEHLCKKLLAYPNPRYQYYIIMGKSYPEPGKIYHLLSGNKAFCVLHDIRNMAELMGKMDIAISAAGTTVYELMCVGVPAIVFGTIDIHESFSRLEPNIIWAGDIKALSDAEFDVKMNRILELLYALGENRQKQDELADHALRYMDGRGASRLCDEIISLGSLRGTDGL